jgi:hypothetical protein
MNLNFAAMQATQNLHMFDKCNLTNYNITYGDYGEEIETPVVTSGIDCGFSYVRTQDRDTGIWYSTGNEAALRLPIGTPVTNRTDVTVVSGIAASGIWHVDGEPQISKTCIVLNLTKEVV